MDLKGWKVKSADGKKAVLMHDKGHFMSIAMKSLSRAQQAQIQHLASGGSVHKETTQPGVSKAGALVRANEPDDLSYAKDIHKRTLKHLKSDKGNRTNLADGGPVLDPDKTKQFEAGFGGKPAPKPAPAPAPAPKPQYYDDGGGVAPDNSRVYPAQGLSPDGTLNPSAALGMEQQAAREQASVDSQKAQAISPIEGATSKQLQQLYNGPDQPDQLQSQVNMYQGLRKHTDEFRDYVEKNDINPQHFQESMGGTRKANAAIGLMLGGMAGGLSGHGGNVAMDFLNKQIDRDIDAQKANINNRHTVLGAYQHLYGEGVVAQNMAKASMLDIYAHKVNKVAVDLGTKQAHAAALAFQGATAFKREEALRTAATIAGTANVMGQPLNAPDQSEASTPPPGASNIMSKTMGGSPVEPEQPVEVGGPSTMMFPDAEKQYQRLANNQKYLPAVAAAMPGIDRAYNQARHAERSMKIISDIYPKLTKERTLGEFLMSNLPGSEAVKGGGVALAAEHGLSGLKALIPAAGLATAAAAAPEIAAGAGLATAAGALAYQNPMVKRYVDAGIKGTGDEIDKMKQYNADKVRIEEALLTSFPNMGEHERAELVKKVCPVWGDSPAVLEKKASHLKSIFRSQVDTDMLEHYHLMPGRLKK